MKIERLVESGQGRVRVTLETLDVEAHSKFERNDMTKSQVKYIMDSAVHALLHLLTTVRSNKE
jgi:molybdenum cofactor biosynthesis enzyme MoaA